MQSDDPEQLCMQWEKALGIKRATDELKIQLVGSTINFVESIDGRGEGINAFKIKALKKDQIIVSIFGDGATDEGVYHESINFAAVMKLPVLFICENNLYSVYSNLEVRQPKGRKIYEMVKGFCEVGVFEERVARCIS